MKSEVPQVRCSRCGGTGFCELSGEYLVTLRLLQKIGGERTAAEMGRLMRVNATAMSNRLAVLQLMGFLTSRRFGRKRLFTAKAEGK